MRDPILPSGLRVLCTALQIPGHMIPVAVLAETFRDHGARVTILAFGEQSDRFYRQLGLKTLCLPKSVHDPDLMLRTIRKLKPDVTICDWRRDFWLATHCCRPKCTVSVLRCEQFLGNHRLAAHLTEKFPARPLPIISRWLVDHGIRKVRNIRQLYVGDVIVVPSVPALDPPPPENVFYHDSRFVYTGPLALGLDEALPNALKEWLAAKHRQKRKVLLATFGTVWGDSEYRQLAVHCREQGFSTVLVVPRAQTREELQKLSDDNVLVTGFVPMLRLMSAVDVIVHHCGHATALLALLSGRPTITVSSNECDREDNAIRLERAGCNRRLSLRDLETGKASLKALVDESLSSVATRKAVVNMASRVRQQMARVGTRGVLAAVAEKLHDNARRSHRH